MRIHARITGTGSYLPGSPVTNDALIAAHRLDSSDEWIVERTGIRVRHFAPKGMTTSDLALEAARRALEAAFCQPNEIDLIIVATSTPDYVFPSVATLLQAKLGNTNGAPAFDMQAVCGGFVYALSIAEKFIQTGTHRCALVVGAETFSRMIDWSDRTTCVLFGDGAGAVVLKASEDPGILASALHADGRYHSILSAPGHLCGGQPIGDPLIRMDGQAVFKFAVRALTEVAEETLVAANLPSEQLDWLVPHQANIRIIQATAKKLHLPSEKCIVTVERHGNTSAASVPLALDEAVRAKKIKRRDTLLLEGIGAGFTWGSILVRF